MKRNCKIHLSLSSDEKNKIQKKAEVSGMSVSEYSRVVLLNGKIKIVYNP